MDTGQFSNILKAVGQPTQTPMAGTSSPLSYEQQSDNYNTFSEMMRKGIYLPDLLKRLDDMEAKVKALESQPKHDTNAELFSVMESAVRNSDSVRDARQNVADVKTQILTEICMKDKRFADAVSEYQTIVKREYIRQKESLQEGSPIEKDKN